jgi:hypothetical protein
MKTTIPDELKASVSAKPAGEDSNSYSRDYDRGGHKARRTGLERDDARPIRSLACGAAAIEGRRPMELFPNELQVRQSNISAERHHRRSQRFFFGMLGAQAAVIVSTFSLAAQQRNLLWSLAAAAGLAAIAFAIYVYFYI